MVNVDPAAAPHGAGDKSGPDAPRFDTLLGALARQVETAPDRTAFTMAPDGLLVDATLSYGALSQQAHRVAQAVRQQSQPGDRVLLLYPPGLDFIVGFLGCLIAGCIAVPAYPPRRSQRAERVRGIAADCGATLALTITDMVDGLSEKLSGNAGNKNIDLLTTDQLSPTSGQASPVARDTSQPLALLQYTSGSTGDPKGVVITHRNLVENAAAIETMMAFDRQSVLVSWLPNFHDMGLITSVVLPLYTGFVAHLMPPAAFVRKPIVWLTRISQDRASHAGCPNFGYDLCVEKVSPEEARTLDLSGWRIALNGAEPVQARTLTTFSDRFALAGFDIAAFRPCFGMAESTLYVTGGGPVPQPTFRALDADALRSNRLVEPADDGPSKVMVGCGTPPPGVSIRVADPVTRRSVGDDAIGEVWLSGPSIGEGYWGRPAETERTFEAVLADLPEQGRYLRTGDLGFVRDGQLYITGRIKDTLILRGQTTCPLDFEVVASEADPALARGQAIAFPLAVDGTDQLALAVEVRREVMRKIDPADVCARIRGAIVAEFDIDPVLILLLPPLALPKTSSGKVQRSLCRKLYEDGGLKHVGSWNRAPVPATADAALAVTNAPKDRSAADIAQWVTDWIATHRAVPRARIGLTTPFVDLGLDSVAAVQLSDGLSRYLGWAPPNPTTLAWTCPTIAALAEYLTTGPVGGEPSAPSKSNSSDAVNLHQDLAGLSEKELARMLARELEGTER